MKVPQGDPAPIGRFGEGKQPGFQQAPSPFECTPFLRIFLGSCRQSHGRDKPEKRLKGSALLEKLVQGLTRKMLQEADKKLLLLPVAWDLLREGDAVQEKFQEGDGEPAGGFSGGHEVAGQCLVIRLFVGNRGMEQEGEGRLPEVPAGSSAELQERIHVLRAGERSVSVFFAQGRKHGRGRIVWIHMFSLPRAQWLEDLTEVKDFGF